MISTIVSKKSLMILSFVTLIASSAFSQKKTKEKVEKDKELDKKVFLIDLTETGKKKAEPDEISFTGNKLKSKIMTEKKFAPDMYTVSVDSSSGEKVITFESTIKNEGGEEILWNGTVKGEDIEGTAVLSKKGKTKKEYEFSGSLKTKKKK